MGAQFSNPARKSQKPVASPGRGSVRQLKVFDHPVDPAGAIEEAIVGVDMEMDEILIGRRHGCLGKDG